jgi:hypothetical protein
MSENAPNNATNITPQPVRVGGGGTSSSSSDGTVTTTPVAGNGNIPTIDSGSESLDGVGVGTQTPVAVNPRSLALNRTYWFNQNGAGSLLNSYGVGTASISSASVPVRNSRSGPQVNIEDTSRTTLSLNFTRDPLDPNVYRADLSAITNATGSAVSSREDLERLLVQRGVDIRSTGMNIRRANIEYGVDNKPYLRLNTSPVVGTQYTIAPTVRYNPNNSRTENSWNVGVQFKLSWGGSQPPSWSGGINGGYQNGALETSVSATAERVTATNPVLQGVYLTVPTSTLRTELQNNLLTPNNTLNPITPSNQIRR